MKGPSAPKDPVEKRAALYVTLDKTISGTIEPDDKCRDHIYLEGRLRDQIRFTSGKVEDDILDLLTDVKGFRKLVHSVGVTVTATNVDNRDKEVEFQLQCYGKTNKYTTGTLMEMTVPCDGEEQCFKVEDYPVNDDDTILGQFNVIFPDAKTYCAVTVKFYVNDGYDVPMIEVDPPVDFDSDAYKKMIADSLISVGNTYRMKKVIEKAKKGEDVTIAYIGGSITQGAGGKPINTKCYAYLAYEQFCQMFSPCHGDNVHYVKAGVGGTSSEFGMIRYEQDVLANGKNEPDLVIVEYAVNDEGDETKGVCYESLVRKILESDNAPAVLLNFAVFMNDWNLQDRMIPVGDTYELPMVSIKNAVVPQFDVNNVMTKRQFFYDIYHPSNAGHQVMADCLGYAFKMIDEAEVAKSDVDLTDKKMYGYTFSKVERFDRSNANDYALVNQKGFDGKDSELHYSELNMDLVGTAQFPDNWTKDAQTEDAFFKMNIEGRNLLIVMKDSGDSNFGKADIFVDGVLARTVDPLQNGWSHCNALVVFEENETAKHEIEIKMHPGDEKKKFTILGFGITK